MEYITDAYKIWIENILTVEFSICVLEKVLTLRPEQMCTSAPN